MPRTSPANKLVVSDFQVGIDIGVNIVNPYVSRGLKEVARRAGFGGGSPDPGFASYSPSAAQYTGEFSVRDQRPTSNGYGGSVSFGNLLLRLGCR